jgi:hypothetical protein
MVFRYNNNNAISKVQGPRPKVRDHFELHFTSHDLYLTHSSLKSHDPRSHQNVDPQSLRIIQFFSFASVSFTESHTAILIFLPAAVRYDLN